MKRKVQHAPPLKNKMNYYKKVIPDSAEVKLLNIVGTEVHYEDRVILDRAHLKWVIGVFKKEGKKIVYTSGVYDMLHEGHVKYLEQAKKLGDILLVAVDSNELTRQRKQDRKNRPIVDLKERLLMLAHTRSVNILTVRDTTEHEDQLIVDLNPDITVFSKTTKDVPDFEMKIRRNLKKYCGEVVFFEPQASTSTTARIRLLTMDGAGELGTLITDTVQHTVQNYLNPQNGGNTPHKKKGGAR